MRRTRRVVTGNGFAMIAALVTIALMTLISAAVVQVAISEYATAAAYDHSVHAFHVAEGALERGLAVLRTITDWSGFSTTSWQELYDPFRGGPTTDVPFPVKPGVAPVGTYSIRVRHASAMAPPGGPCSTVGSGTLDPVNNAWVRVLGRVGRTARAVEFLAHRLTPGDMTTYSAQDVVLNDSSALGAGNVEVHGSLYVRGDLGLKAVKTGIYNDRPVFSSETEPPGYCNQLFVRGTLDMTKGNATVGTPAQPMWAVHAWQIKLKKGVSDPTTIIYTKSLDNRVPDIPYPDVAGYVTRMHASGDHANALSDGRLVMCREISGTVQPAEFSEHLDLTDSAGIFYLPTKAYWTAHGRCTSAVREAAHHALKWDPSVAPGRLTFNTALTDLAILVRGRVRIGRDVVYSGIGTVAVDYPDVTQWALDSGGSAGKNPAGDSPLPGPCPSDRSCQILARKPASGGVACTSDFATTPTSMPCHDLAVFIVNGNVRLNGSSTVARQENDVIVVAGDTRYPSHTFMSLNKVIVYGIVIANKLDTSQNPDFRQVPDIANHMPFPFASVLGTSGGAVVLKVWRELY